MKDLYCLERRCSKSPMICECACFVKTTGLDAVRKLESAGRKISRFLRFIPIYINDESMTEYGRRDVLTTCHGLPSRDESCECAVVSSVTEGGPRRVGGGGLASNILHSEHLFSTTCTESA